MQAVDKLKKCEDKLKSLMNLGNQESSTGLLRERDRLLERAYNLLLIGSKIDKEKPPARIKEEVNNINNYIKHKDWKPNSSIVETLIN